MISCFKVLSQYSSVVRKTVKIIIKSARDFDKYLKLGFLEH